MGMDPQKMINGNIQAGKDIVFAEQHAAIAQTFDFMRATIEQNPGTISAVALELPTEIQSFIDKAATGGISEEVFAKQVRITMEQTMLENAQALLSDEIITQEDYNKYEASINLRVDDVLRGTNIEYSVKNQQVDTEAFSSLYKLAQTAHTQNIPVIANDLDRETTVLVDLGRMTPEYFLGRVDDNSDHEHLAGIVDLDKAGPLLIHRGVAHTWDLDGYVDGLDDTLQKAGRDVVTIGHYKSLKELKDAVVEMDDVDLSIEDPTDQTIVGNQGFDQSDQSVFQQSFPSMVPKL